MLSIQRRGMTGAKLGGKTLMEAGATFTGNVADRRFVPHLHSALAPAERYHGVQLSGAGEDHWAGHSIEQHLGLGQRSGFPFASVQSRGLGGSELSRK
jgi:hypothetical protein